MSSSSVLSPTRGRTRRFLAGVLAAALTAGVTAAAAAPSYADEPAAAEQRAAAGTVYEAENGTLTGVSVQTEHAGYTGTGFVGGFGSTGNAVSVAATVETAGTYDLFVRYANGGPSRTLTLGVNDATRQVTLPGSGAWNSYGVVWASVDLQAGANTLSLTRTAADSGSLNVDNFRVAPRVGTRYEAENANLSGGAAPASDHAGYTGTAFVGGIQAVGSTVAFTVTATEAGNHPATLRYAAGPNPFNGAKKVTLDVNGAQQTILLPGFSSWKTWGDYALDLPLVAGENQVAIRYTAGDDGNVNLDHLDVGQPAPPVCDPVVEPDDAFDGTALDRCRWTTILNEDPTGYDVADGVLSIDALPGDLSGGVTNARNVIFQDAPTDATWMAETAVSLDGADDYLQGGLVLWGNAANFAKLTVIRTPADGWKVELGKVTANNLQYTGSATLPAGAQTDVRLRMWVSNGLIRGSYSLDDGATWVVVGSGYAVDGITGALVGLGAFNGAGTETARFESFAVGQPVAITPTVTVSPATVETGRTTTVTVTVAGSGAAPTGSVSLRDHDVALGSALLVDGVVTIDVGPYEAAGTRTLTAEYAGDTAYAAAAGTGTLTVTPALVASTTTLDPGSVRVGETSYISVNVSAQGTTPTGQVTLSEGDMVLGTAPLNGGVALFQAGPYSTAGTRTLTATYAGSATVAGSTGTGTLTVTPAPVASTTEVLTDRAGIRVGESSSVHVSVLAEGTTATGKVTLFEGGEFVSSGNLENGAIDFPVGPYTTPGVRQFTAVYDGSATVTGSTGGASLDVSPALVAPTVELTGPASVRTGQTADVTVDVSAEGVTPTGEVSITDGESTWTGTLADGSVVVPVGPWATAGTRTLTATYAGDDDVTAGTDTLAIVVQAPPAPTPVVKVVGGKVDAAANRKSATVKLSCTPAGVTCRGTLTLRAGGKVLGTGTFPGLVFRLNFSYSRTNSGKASASCCRPIKYPNRAARAGVVGVG